MNILPMLLLRSFFLLSVISIMCRETTHAVLNCIDSPKEWIALGKKHLLSAFNSFPSEKKEELTSTILKLQEIETLEALHLAHLLQAELSLNFIEKESLYKVLDTWSEKDPFFEEGLMLRCKNFMNWGMFLLHKGFQKEGEALLKKMDNFLKPLILSTSKKFHSHAVFLKVQLALKLNEDKKESLSLLKSLSAEDLRIKELEKIYEVLLDYTPFDRESLSKLYAALESTMQQNALIIDASSTLKEALFHAAALFFDYGYYKEAGEILMKIVSSKEPSNPEYLFLAAIIKEKQDLHEEKRYFLQLLIDFYPTHPLIDEAEFIFYSISEYLTGGRPEIKHLEHYIKTHKESSFLPLAYYVMGLDLKRDRKTADGKWIQRKSLTEAIDAFSLVTSSFEHLNSLHLIPENQIPSSLQLALIAKLEQGSLNWEIARESKGAKRILYLEYAKEVFSSIMNSFQEDSHFLLNLEAKLSLAEVHLELGENKNAEEKLQEIIRSHPKTLENEWSYAKAHLLLARALMKREAYEEALISLALAEKECDGFSSEEKICLLMQRGYCLKSIGSLDEAMKAFSSVVNIEGSSLRVESMFERAHIYKMQNRMDLYRKQLEAIIKIGGEWEYRAKKLIRELQN